MGKTLVIAEKPSVAADIARALGGFVRHKDYYENDRYIISSAVGHLLELTEPEEFKVKRGKWSFEHLPVIPTHFDLTPLEGTKERLKLLEKLINRKDVDTIVNACDAGREGELIFRHIIKYTGTTKPIKRLWLQSMTPEAIREGFNNLRSDEELQPLANAAFCRSEADWLVGINGTRAMTAFNSRSGGFQKTTVGRVQTPTLAIVVEREEKIRNFVPRDYWEVHATFIAEAGEYVGKWFDESFTKDKNKENDSELKPERLWSVEKAEEIKAKCIGKRGIVTEESKPSTSLSPLLYDLTTLQREANSKFGFSASTTLKIAQSLYEKYKAITYPRTDSRALPEDYIPTAKAALKMLTNTKFAQFAETILGSNWVKPNKRIFNNAKVSDHFAIIPTTLAPKNLNDQENQIYEMVVKRFLAVFYPPAEFLITTRITRVEGEPFKSEGKVLTFAGWLTVYGKEVQDNDSPNLPPVKPDEKVNTKDILIKALQTKPPPRFTEATLLSAMESAGKLIEDEELREAMLAKGLGTPATRAAIIDGLLEEKYLERRGRELVPTPKAFSLITLLRGLNIPELTSPEMTGDWEYKLKLMERGQFNREDFMREIAEMTRTIVNKAKSYESSTVPGNFGKLKTPCPKCSGEIVENYKKFQCSKCDFYIWKIIAGKQLDIPEAEKLISERKLGPVDGFRSKTGKPFTAILKLNDNYNVTFEFLNGNNHDTEGEKINTSTQEPLGNCPKCGARVFENSTSYFCEKSVGENKTCDFKTSKTILQQPISREQMAKLLANGKTDLLEKFVSKYRRKQFKAFLVLKDGKVQFEFEKNNKETNKIEKTNEKIEIIDKTPLGECPKCGSNVLETKDSYFCEKFVSEENRCDFKINKIILNQKIDRVQATKLLTDKKTDLLDGFVSKNNRKFSAFLVITKSGKVKFEFELNPKPTKTTVKKKQNN